MGALLRHAQAPRRSDRAPAAVAEHNVGRCGLDRRAAAGVAPSRACRCDVVCSILPEITREYSRFLEIRRVEAMWSAGGRERWEDFINQEVGGMSEALGDLSLLSGDPAWANLEIPRDEARSREIARDCARVGVGKPRGQIRAAVLHSPARPRSLPRRAARRRGVGADGERGEARRAARRRRRRRRGSDREAARECAPAHAARRDGAVRGDLSWSRPLPSPKPLPGASSNPSPPQPRAPRLQRGRSVLVSSAQHMARSRSGVGRPAPSRRGRSLLLRARRRPHLCARRLDCGGRCACREQRPFTAPAVNRRLDCGRGVDAGEAAGGRSAASARGQLLGADHEAVNGVDSHLQL